MAQNYTPEEIDEIVRIANEELKQFGTITAATVGRLKDAETAIKNYTANLNASMKALGTSMKQLGRGILDGAVGAEQYSDALSKGADAVADFATKFGMVGKLLGGAIKGVTAYTTAVSRQADALTKSYQDIARAGAGTVGGITDVFESMQKLNYGIAELADFGALVKANSETLTAFGLTAGRGVKQLANLGTELQRSDIGYQFRLMGMSVDDINKGIAGYLKLQTLTGGIGKKSAEDQAKAAADYIRELDALTKITGKTREDAQAAQESAMAEERYAAFRYELKQRADMGDQEAKERLKQIEANQVFLDKVGPETRKGFLNILSGAMDTPEAQKLLLTMPRAAAEAGKRTFDANAFQQAALQDINENLSGAGTQLAKIGANNDTFIAIQEQMRLKSVLETGTIDERRAAAERDQTVTDAATKNMTQMADAQRSARDSLQSLINAGINPVTSAMKGLAGVIDSISRVPGAVAPSLAPQVAPTTGAPTAAPPTAAGGYLQKMIQAESGGRNIANQSGPGGAATSSAFGIAQITKGTFEDLVKKAGRENPLFGKTFADMKSNTDLQMAAAQQLTDQNRAFLAKQGLSTSDAALYLAHFLGAGGAAKVLGNNDMTDLSSVLSQQAIAANPMLQKMQTVGDLKAWADQKMGGSGYRNGGIATGPASGYPSILHGTEAVVPLPDGKTIPVEIAGGSISPEHIEKLTNMLTRLESSVAGNQSQSASDLMVQQLMKMEEMVNTMRNQLTVSQQILQYTQ